MAERLSALFGLLNEMKFEFHRQDAKDGFLGVLAIHLTV
jgi:hypothetical protein